MLPLKLWMFGCTKLSTISKQFCSIVSSEENYKGNNCKQKLLKQSVHGVVNVFLGFYPRKSNHQVAMQTPFKGLQVIFQCLESERKPS